MENFDGNVMMNTCKISKGNKKSIINCNVKKFGNKYKDYKKDCKEANGEVVHVTSKICMTPDMMSPDMRKLENSNEDPDAAIQNDPFNGGPVKIILRNIPMCFAKSCNDESKEIMEGAVKNLYEKMGLSCPWERSNAKFAFKVKKNKKVKKMTCKNLTLKKPDLIKKICFSKEFQTYSDSILPASQVCKVTCKPDVMNMVEEDPKGGGKFSVMRMDGNGIDKEVIMTCGDLRKKSMSKDEAMDALWTCLLGYKGDKKVNKNKIDKISKTYGDAHEVCQDTCSTITQGMDGDN